MYMAQSDLQLPFFVLSLRKGSQQNWHSRRSEKYFRIHHCKALPIAGANPAQNANRHRSGRSWILLILVDSIPRSIRLFYSDSLSVCFIFLLTFPLCFCFPVRVSFVALLRFFNTFKRHGTLKERNHWIPIRCDAKSLFHICFTELEIEDIDVFRQSRLWAGLSKSKGIQRRLVNSKHCKTCKKKTALGIGVVSRCKCHRKMSCLGSRHSRTSFEI